MCTPHQRGKHPPTLCHVVFLLSLKEGKSFPPHVVIAVCVSVEKTYKISAPSSLRSISFTSSVQNTTKHQDRKTTTQRKKKISPGQVPQRRKQPFPPVAFRRSVHQTTMEAGSRSDKEYQPLQSSLLCQSTTTDEETYTRSFAGKDMFSRLGGDLVSIPLR